MLFGKKILRGLGGGAPYTVQLNARLRPLARRDLFESPLEKALNHTRAGKVTSDGGTLLNKEGEIQHCDIEIVAPKESDGAEATIILELEALGAPKGSFLIAPDGTRRVPFGVAEGMGVYLDGTGLPTEVYSECDINLVIERFASLLGDRGRMLDYWEGPKETALYYYGSSFQGMADAIAPFVAEYPLLQGCRIVQIA